MALLLSVPTEFGVDATYHRIASVQADWLQGTTCVTLQCFATQNTACKPLGTLQVQLPLADLSRVALYSAIKQQPDWQEAADA